MLYRHTGIKMTSFLQQDPRNVRWALSLPRPHIGGEVSFRRGTKGWGADWGLMTPPAKLNSSVKSSEVSCF